MTVPLTQADLDAINAVPLTLHLTLCRRRHFGKTYWHAYLHPGGDCVLSDDCPTVHEAIADALAKLEAWRAAQAEAA